VDGLSRRLVGGTLLHTSDFESLASRVTTDAETKGNFVAKKKTSVKSQSFQLETGFDHDDDAI
jgi:hypothetical protein